MADELKVLIVEDEPRLREMLLRAVREMGFVSSGVRTAEEALRVQNNAEHDIVMLDLNLPGMGGMELLTAVRNHWPATAAIVLTGFGDLDAAKKAIHLDVVDFLTKPCPLGDIEAALERARRRVRPPVKMAVAADPPPPPPGASLEEVERQSILASLERHRGNRTAAATELGISVRKLYYRLAQYRVGGEEEEDPPRRHGDTEKRKTGE